MDEEYNDSLGVGYGTWDQCRFCINENMCDDFTNIKCRFDPINDKFMCEEFEHCED